MYLLIDTSTKQINVGLANEKGLIGHLCLGEKYQTEKLLFLIDWILSKHRVSLEDLKGIIVNKGPGFFTGLRIGIVISNILSWILAIPIVGIETQKDPVNIFNYLLKEGLNALKKRKKFLFISPKYKYTRKPSLTRS